jgi:hypothetical protein
VRSSGLVERGKWPDYITRFNEGVVPRGWRRGARFCGWSAASEAGASRRWEANGSLFRERAAAVNWRKTASPSAKPPAPGRDFASPRCVRRVELLPVHPSPSEMNRGLADKEPTNPLRTCQVQMVTSSSSQPSSSCPSSSQPSSWQPLRITSSFLNSMRRSELRQDVVGGRLQLRPWRPGRKAPECFAWPCIQD